MRKSVAIVILIFAGILASPNFSEAQKIYHIGVLLADDLFVPAFEGFKQKMEKLGYIERKNIKYDLYKGNLNVNLLTLMAQKLVRGNPDLIVASSATAASALESSTKGTTIPVVFLSVADPLQFAESYIGSGNNFAGVSTSTIDLTGKRMELLKELAPKVKKVITLHNSSGPNYQVNLHATRKAAKRLGLDLAEVTVASSGELIQRAPVLLTRNLGEAIVYPPDRIVIASQKEILPQVIKERLPTIAAAVKVVHEGALATYAADYFALGQQGALLGDKILKGARPMDLPIEQPFKLQLTLNLRTAKAIGLKIPKEILLRTDELIE